MDPNTKVGHCTGVGVKPLFDLRIRVTSRRHKNHCWQQMFWVTSAHETYESQTLHGTDPEKPPLAVYRQSYGSPMGRVWEWFECEVESKLLEQSLKYHRSTGR